MEALLARYLDGDLSEEEAARLIEAAATDPEFDRILRAHEQLLACSRSLAAPSLDDDFTDEVMHRVRDEAELSGELPAGSVETGIPAGRAVRTAARPHPRPFRSSRRWLQPALAAAIALVLFGGGFLSGRLAPVPTLGGGDDVAAVSITPAQMPGGERSTPAILAGPAAGAQWVRFVYQPRDGSPSQVHVAGSFNGWNATALPMQWDGRVWSTFVLLPAGQHEYMFVEDGARWVTDPLAPRTLDDGFGGRNAVVEIRA